MDFRMANPLGGDDAGAPGRQLLAFAHLEQLPGLRRRLHLAADGWRCPDFPALPAVHDPSFRDAGAGLAVRGCPLQLPGLSEVEELSPSRHLEVCPRRPRRPFRLAKVQM